MYSRYSNRPEKPIRLPEHYSGCAFSDRHLPTDPPHPGVARPSPPPPPAFPPPERAKPTDERPHDHAPVPPSEEQNIAPTACKPPEPRSPLADAGLFGAADFDRILLTALILLLSHTKENSDMMLWLFLLMLCG